MKLLFSILSCSLFIIGNISAQSDTTIYQVPQQKARFPACEHIDTTLEAKLICAEQAMLNFVHSRITYPQAAYEQGIEGTVVLAFVVEKDGSITQLEAVKDLGHGTAKAAMAVVELMQNENLKWVAAQHEGQTVRSKYILPVRFKIQEPLPYFIHGRDTIYTITDQALDYKGGAEALQEHLLKELKYPSIGEDDCRSGQIDIQVLVQANGHVRILDLVDYNELGFDFWYAAIDAATSTYGQWIPAQYEGKTVASAFDLSLSFTPTSSGCSQAVERYQNALALANEGTTLFNEDKKEEGIAKLSEAITLFPRDAQLLILRGQAYLSNEQYAEACSDLSLAKKISLVRSFDNVLPLICE